MERTDTSGFIDDRDPAAPTFITIKEGANTRLSRMMRHGRWWAVKSAGTDIDPQLANALLLKEFNLLLRLGHPNVVRAVEYAELPGLGWAIVMEWVEGMPLDRYLEEEKPGRKLRRRLALELMEGVGHLHSRGVVYRDLKPSNILVDGSGHPCIIDLGLGDDAASCMLKQVSGTAGFTAPEVSEGRPDTDWRRADVYALGLLLRLTGGSAALRLTARLCRRRKAGSRPADAREVLRLYRRLRPALRVAGLLVCGAAAAGLIWLAASQSGEPQSAPAPATAPTAPSRPAEIPAEETAALTGAPAAEQTPRSVPDGEPSPAPSAGNAPGQDTRVPPDVNLVLFRAMDVRDSLRSLAGKGEPYDTATLESIMSDYLRVGRKEGWNDAEASHFKTQVSSEAFYQGSYVKFYVGE